MTYKMQIIKKGLRYHRNNHFVLYFSTCLILFVLISACSPSSKQLREQQISEHSEIIYHLLVAKIAAQQKNKQEAITHYSTVIEHISDVNTLKQVAKSLYNQGEYDTAIRVIEHLLTIEPKNVFLQQRLAILYLGTRQLEKAIAMFKQLKAEGNSDVLFLEIGQHGLLDTDISILDSVREVAKHFSDDVMFQYFHAKLANQFKQYIDVISIADKMIAQTPAFFLGYQIKAHALKALDKNDDAFAVLKKGVSVTPKGIELKKEYARMLIEREMHHESYKQLLQVYASYPQDYDILQMLGMSSIGIGKIEEALRYFKILEAVPGMNLRAQYFQAHALYAEDKYDAAIALLNEIPAASGSLFEEAQMFLARVYIKADRFEDALNQFQRARQETDNRDMRINFYLAEARLLRQEKRYSELYVLCSEALEQYHDESALRYQRAIAAAELKHLRLMEDDMKYILDREPDHANALNAFGYVLADNNLRLEEAKSYIEKALEIKADDPKTMDSMGWVEFKLKHFKQAEKWMRKAIKGERNPISLGHLIEILRVTHRIQEAGQLLNSAIKEFPDNSYLIELQKI